MAECTPTAPAGPLRVSRRRCRRPGPREPRRPARASATGSWSSAAPASRRRPRRLARDATPDVVVIDPRLPEHRRRRSRSSRRLRARRAGRPHPRASSCVRHRERPDLAARADGFVRKTFRPNELIDAVVSHVAVRSAGLRPSEDPSLLDSTCRPADRRQPGPIGTPPRGADRDRRSPHPRAHRRRPCRRPDGPAHVLRPPARHRGRRRGRRRLARAWRWPAGSSPTSS